MGPEWKWAGYKDSVEVRNTIWEEFKEYLLDSITDKDNCILDTSARYENTAQHPGQSVDNFITYLNSLEQELHIRNDQQRQRALYGKLC